MRVPIKEYYISAKVLSAYRDYKIYSLSNTHHFLQNFRSMEIPSVSSSSTYHMLVNTLELALQICEISLFTQTNLLYKTKRIFTESLQPFFFSEDSVLPNSYTFLSSQRSFWKKEVKNVHSQYYYRSFTDEKPLKKKKLKMEFVTYASNVTDGFENLLFSSIIAGVKLKVRRLPSSFSLVYTFFP
jgi:hypothetical protein